MPYCTEQDIENRITRKALVELTNDGVDAQTPDSAVVSTLIAKADGTIDAKVGVVYAVPFSPVPDIIKLISIDLACYFAMQRRFLEVQMPEDWQKTYKDAMAMLDSIASLQVKLNASPVLEGSTAKIVANDRVVDFFSTTSPQSKY